MSPFKMKFLPFVLIAIVITWICASAAFHIAMAAFSAVIVVIFILMSIIFVNHKFKFHSWVTSAYIVFSACAAFFTYKHHLFGMGIIGSSVMFLAIIIAFEYWAYKLNKEKNKKQNK